MKQLDHLRSMTKIAIDYTGAYDRGICDSGICDGICPTAEYYPEDATTNMSFIHKLISKGKYPHLMDEAMMYSIRKHTSTEERLTGMVDMLSCLIGREMTHVVRGYVSIEVDARLSYDTRATVERTYRLLDIYDGLGVDPKRIMIKLAATWEMMEACRILQKNGINCNMTLILSLPQAVAAAQMHAKMISPTVGNIFDWYKAQNAAYFELDKFYDPGVATAKQIYNYFKYKEFDTIVMATSFRTKKQILDLAGIDRLAISSKLLAELHCSKEGFERVLSVERAKDWYTGRDYPQLDESKFRHLLCKDPMATKKLNDGVNECIQDIHNLEYLFYRRLIQKKITH